MDILGTILYESYVYTHTITTPQYYIARLDNIGDSEPLSIFFLKFTVSQKYIKRFYDEWNFMGSPLNSMHDANNSVVCLHARNVTKRFN